MANKTCAHGLQHCGYCHYPDGSPTGQPLSSPVHEAIQVLERLAEPGWLSDALQSGNIEAAAKELCALKREARAVIAQMKP